MIAVDNAKLIEEMRPWYEIKASLLKESDIPLIRDQSGMSYDYDILISGVKDRAHLPPNGYHFGVRQMRIAPSTEGYHVGDAHA
ncbi:hypothetical protein F511_18391 [Dorcoceras hygrometricum]|uniref:Uncharacterized protein n=1 Tax=Dorcoceras hygrometricum TaxID=472368 RepID=A0A2Z7A4U1_9LAMI|nr:hypothetical protein F511_10088 [Dorcoceras hygrometricum]KZV42045.1 hypothetical protein F511_18391 [Dorcoceras hygrometricum]